MTHFFTTFHWDNNSQRRAELMLALRINAESVDRVYVACERKGPGWNDERVEEISVAERPTVGDVIAAACDHINFKSADIVLLGNADIVVTAKAVEQMQAIQCGECYALARWEASGLFGVDFSNDLWAFRGPPPLIDAPYWWGVPGVDNRLCADLEAAGLTMSNPSRTIRTFHMHTSRIRTDTNVAANRVPPPYLFIAPHELGEQPKYRRAKEGMTFREAMRV